MAENSTYGNITRMRGENVWGNVAIPEIEHEDRLSASDARDVWNDVFRLFRATGEEAQREVKLAVYAYYGVNGASRRTKHSRDINTGGGASVLASDVGNVIGMHRIRQFLRADVAEAYSALKETGVLENDEVFVSKAMEKGVPRGFMHCAVDYLRGCSLLTEEEKIYVDHHFSYSIQRARGARGGLTVDEEDVSNRGRHLSQQRETSRLPLTSAGVDEF
eukprot:c30029_g1_i1 orf=112-768(+)